MLVPVCSLKSARESHTVSIAVGVCVLSTIMTGDSEIISNFAGILRFHNPRFIASFVMENPFRESISRVSMTNTALYI